MTITMIAAVARNRAIGYANRLIYWLPDDLRRFRELTTGHTIVMGRRTYDSLPKGALPHRRNCVLSRSVASLPGCECFASWEALAATCREDEQVYIIGGASLYDALIGRAGRLCLTEVADTPALADTFFPDYSRWREVRREHHEADDRHAYAYDFVDYVPQHTGQDRETAITAARDKAARMVNMAPFMVEKYTGREHVLR